METGRKAALVGLFTVAMFAKLGALSDGKMGVSAERAERIRAAVTAQRRVAIERV